MNLCICLFCRISLNLVKLNIIIWLYSIYNTQANALFEIFHTESQHHEVIESSFMGDTGIPDFCTKSRIRSLILNFILGHGV